jgi:hypothetical protein
MGTVETRNIIHDTINHMPPEKLDAVLSFLEDLRRSSEDETAMLMSDPGFMKDYQDAKKDIRSGKTVSLKAIHRNVVNYGGSSTAGQARSCPSFSASFSPVFIDHPKPLEGVHGGGSHPNDTKQLSQ